MSPQGPLPRRTYLLRVWEERTSPTGARALRFLLQEAHTGQRQGFGSLELLVDYLRTQLVPGDTGDDLPPDEPARPTDSC